MMVPALPVCPPWLLNSSHYNDRLCKSCNCTHQTIGYNSLHNDHQQLRIGVFDRSRKLRSFLGSIFAGIWIFLIHNGCLCPQTAKRQIKSGIVWDACDPKAKKWVGSITKELEWLTPWHHVGILESNWGHFISATELDSITSTSEQKKVLKIWVFIKTCRFWLYMIIGLNLWVC